MTTRSQQAPAAQPLVLTGLRNAPGEAKVFELTLNRPGKRNALNIPMLELLLTWLIRAHVHQIVLTARGPSFCSGLDLTELRQVATWPVRVRHLEFLEAIYSHLLVQRAHTVAFVQGTTVGGGVGLAACADRVIAHVTARFRIPQGDLARLARIVLPVTAARQAAAKSVECWLAGEIDARQALACGLVDEVLAPDEFSARMEEARSTLLFAPGEELTWRSPKVCQGVLTEMQELIAGME